MSTHRFFLEAPLAHDGEQRLALSGNDVHHATHVARIRVGELIEVVDQDSRVWRVRVSDVDKDGILAVIVEEIRASSSTHVTLFQGVAKGQKMDGIVRQAVEIGADRIVPVVFARSVARPVADRSARQTERLQRVAEAASKQSRRSCVPDVAQPISLARAAEMLSAYDIAVVLWEDARGLSLDGAMRSVECTASSHAALVVGPEGGMAADEVATLEEAGALVASLGDSVLRAETAALVGLSLMIHALGGLGRTGV